ncbi:MAG TPA: S8 family serine peptidase, partial [Gemmatimonadales bacterium]|nr:S8 family serine peptidase [Gemmatimonadales bacterium]
MPLSSTGVPTFLAAHPSWDGRRVLIAILDSGIDPGVPGLDSTSAGRPKILDLRDFSGEGRIALLPVTPRGDEVELFGHRLVGFGRVRGLDAMGPWYGGVLRERPLGELPASDLNDNGSDTDSLVVVVAKASDGWVLFADTDGDGSLANERPVHDFLVARESFGWHRPGAAPPLNLAVNFSEPSSSPSAPILDLVFDTDAHGTHVAGIAAGHDIGGVVGFDGVAPGAQLLGLKISRNDFGGLTTTGSVVVALDYAIRFAAARQLPLIVNMSFGVGNEQEGAARLDALLDSILTAHPAVSFVTSAGNDGPGLSTVGFPGSLRRGITVGATEPAVFLSPLNRLRRSGIEPLLFFSSRGGELAKPDLVAPGTAYSTVPLWNRGEEFKSGTSMASPYVAGLAAILLSAAISQQRSAFAEDLRRALTASGRPLPGQGVLDAGAGLPDLTAAWGALQAPAAAAAFDVEIPGRPGSSAAFALGSADTLVRFRIRRIRGSMPVDLTFASEVSWLAAPGPVRLAASDTVLTLVQHPPATPGVHTATVRASVAGNEAPLFWLVSTIAIPEAERMVPLRVSAKLAPGAARRTLFAVDSGRPFRVRIATAPQEPRLIAALHQPGGAPILGDNGISGGADTAAASFDVDGRDARAGFYEAIAVAPLDAAVSAELSVDPAPVALRRVPAAADSLSITVSSLADSAVSGRFNLGLLGGERRFQTSGSGGNELRIPLRLPAWAARLVIDLELDPGQWPHFTDFGFTALDSAGRILGKSPANYAHARLTVELPARPLDQTGTLALAPGFAEPNSREPWSARLTIRLEASPPIALAAREGDEFRLLRQNATTFTARVAELPW